MAGDVPIGDIVNTLTSIFFNVFFALLKDPFMLMGIIIFLIWVVVEELIKKRHKKGKANANMAALLPYLMSRR